jgi:sugar/nucleoside kinase (ribokinase family)
VQVAAFESLRKVLGNQISIDGNQVMPSMDVVGVGNALVDVQTRVDDSVLPELGIDKGVMTLVDDARQAEVLAKLAGLPLNRCAGGSAANSIVALAEFGGKASYVGKVGRDEVGQFFLDDMQSLGIEMKGQYADAPTGTCAVLITEDAQRTMLTNLGASATLTVDDIDRDLIEGAKYVYIEGYLLTGETTKAAAYKAMDLAVELGVKVALTASDPFLINLIRDEIWDLITGPVDLFFCNEMEAKSLTGESDPVACAAKIHEHAENVALTLGEKGSLVMHGGEAFPIEGLSVKAIDTTGAGDMYAGAMLYGITNGMTWRQAGHLASHAASRVVSQMGARLENKFQADEIAAIVAEVG